MKNKKFLAIIIFIIILIILLQCEVYSVEKFSSSSNRKTKIYNGPLMTGFNIYQLGAYEFILKIYGKDLPEPEFSFQNEILEILIKNSKIENPDKINSSKKDLLKITPLIIDFNAKNESNDIFINIKASAPLNFHSGSKTGEGYTYRITTNSDNNNSFGIQVPSKTNSKINLPQSFLPFQNSMKITLELRDSDIRDVFRVLGSEMKKNIIIDPSLPQNIFITMTLENVRIDEVLNYLMRTYGISCYIIGQNTLAFGTKEGLYKLSGDDDIRTFNIAWADLESLRNIILNLTGLQETRLVVDDRLRKFYIRTNPAMLQEIENLIERLDTPGRQVMIHASIFEFTDSAAKDVENSLNLIYDHWVFNYSSGGGGLIGWTDSQLIREIESEFSILERKGKGKVLANPSVIAIDGQEAKISMTEGYPYISNRDEAGNVSWSTATVGPQLTFTPKIGRDGFVTLKLEIDTGEVISMMVGSTGEQMPRTSNRSVTTEVRVKDGTPFVIGGLFRDNKTVQKLKFPVIGDIPLLGELFKYKQDDRNKTQVVMLVTPYILDTP